ncbi:glycosyltransferase family 4 protein [Lactobacillus acidophilus]|nr:glycosyltransferase family 4 protein [Lactobacillus acidophilus]
MVPEINRAYIQKVWWDLEKTPKILPNKPYKINFENKADDTSRISDIIETMRSDQRLKILYQGVFDKDRKLDEFAKTIENESDKFCLYIMGKQNKYSKELCKKYPHIRYIPYITSPNHLKITREADIGLLPYFPVRVGNNSILNALYCAPNKIYEYSAFGKPMLGTDVLGLKYPFEKYKMGYTVSKLEEKEILEKLNKILVNYQKMSENSRRFFQSVNWDKKIDEILEIKEEEKD